MRIEDPAIIEAGGLGLTCERNDTVRCHVRLQRKSKFEHSVSSYVSLLLDQVAIRLRTPVSVKLPHIANFLNFVEIQVRHDHFFLIARRFCNDLSARRAEITLSVKFADVPWILTPDAINRAHKITIRDGMCRLLEFPKVLTEPCDSCGGIEHDFRSVQTKDPGTLWEVSVITNVNTDFRELRLENGITEIAGPEIKLFPKAGRAMRNVVLAIFSEILSVGIDNGCGVVVNALEILLVNRDDQSHTVFFCNLAHHLNGRAVRNFFHHAIPPRGLFGTEVRTCEDFLQAQDLRTLRGGFFDQLQMLFDRIALDLFERFFSGSGASSLNEGTSNNARHGVPFLQPK